MVLRIRRKQKHTNKKDSHMYTHGSTSHLWIWQLSVLQRGHVAPEPELLAVEPLQVFLPLDDLRLDLSLAAGVRHHAQLEFGHVLQFLVLQWRN